jgi:hypothetical protein
MESKLTKHQKQVFTKDIIWENKPHKMTVTLRYDDEYNNGHNTFSITGEIRKEGNHRNFECGGCIHDEIVKYFPEFKELIKWHLMSSDGPLHYIADTIYWAKDREYINKEIGEPVEFKRALKFKKIPLIFDFKDSFYDFITSVKNWDDVKIVTLEYKKDKDNYTYSPSYTFEGTNSIEWYQGEFKTLQKAQEWLEMFKTFDFDIIQTPIEWNEAKEPNIENAKRSAIWGATELDTDITKLNDEEFLKKRLPLLVIEFKKAMENIGFTY